MSEPCRTCTPTGGPSTMTEADYLRALEMLAEREDLTPAQREQARTWLCAQSRELGDGLPTAGRMAQPA